MDELTFHDLVVTDVPRTDDDRRKTAIDTKGGLMIACAVVRASIDDLGCKATRAQARRFLLYEFQHSIWADWLASVGIQFRAEVMANVVTVHSRRRSRRAFRFRPSRVTRPEVVEEDD